MLILAAKNYCSVIVLYQFLIQREKIHIYYRAIILEGYVKILYQDFQMFDAAPSGTDIQPPEAKRTRLQWKILVRKSRQSELFPYTTTTSFILIILAFLLSKRILHIQTEAK